MRDVQYRTACGGRRIGGSIMKMISAIIKPFKVEEVREALAQVGVTGITICEARGYGHQRLRADARPDRNFTVEFVPKVKVDVILDAGLLPHAIEAIMKAGRTGKRGDGMILVIDLEDTVRIRTGETGALAVA
jgi:nitrogen regulatory protein PII